MTSSHVPPCTTASPPGARCSYFANVRPPHATTFAIVSAAHAPKIEFATARQPHALPFATASSTHEPSLEVANLNEPHVRT